MPRSAALPTEDHRKGKPLRLGILGGTFDPVHNGHLVVAAAVLETLSLDQVLFVPAYQPPHKPSYTITSFRQRVAMLAAAIQGNDLFALSEMEAERQGPSYTYDTLAGLRHSLGDQPELFFLAGVDAFLEIHTWKHYQGLLEFANLAIISRPSAQEISCRSYIEERFPFLSLRPSQGVWSSPQCCGKIYPLSFEPLHLSSTEIRARVQRGERVDHMVPASVLHYIDAHGLYRRGELEG